MQCFATLAIITGRRKIQFSETADLHRANACAQVKRVMKLTGILILIACLHVSANGISQTINLSFENAPLETVLKDIEKQTGYTFFYRTNWVKQAKRVTIKVANVTLQRALELCFKDQPVVYSIMGKIITITLKADTSKSEEKKIESEDAASIDVRGKVVNPKGEPVVGATVSIKGAHQSAITNAEGEFFLNNVNENAVLLISSVGYEAEAIAVNGRKFINAVLNIKITSLDEMQVIAYGKTTKRFNTGNVTTIKSTDIEKQPINNPLLALQGRVPGMQVTQSTGVPGGGVRVEIRGRNSINQGTNPLYIVDGVPYPSQSMRGYSGVNILTDGGLGSPFNYINPADIESIEILKDADATAIYGSRGANGVVLITTKKGKPGKTRAEVNFQSGVGKVTRKMDLLNTSQYLEMRREAFQNDGKLPNPSLDYDLLLWDTTRYTDWQKELLGGTALYNNLQASLSGGNANTQFLIGSGYHKETTVFPGNYSDQKGSVHFNISNTSLNNKFNISFSGLYSIDNNKLSPFNYVEMALLLPPNAPAMYNEDGSLNWAPNSLGMSTWPRGNGNPAATLQSKYNLKTNNLISNAHLSYELIKDLKITGSFGYNNIQTDLFSAVPFSSIDPYSWTTSQRRSQFSNNNLQSWIFEPQINYVISFGKGKMSALLGTTFQQSKGKGITFGASGFSSDQLMDDIRSATMIIPGYNDFAIYKYNAVFGRINYNLKEKYLFNLNGRRDGSSRFGPENRFHDFGSIGAAWLFTKEHFLMDKFPFLSYGKLRGSYGTTGNDQVGDYSYLDLYRSVGSFYLPYQGVTGISPVTLFVPDLAWEETTKLEAGLELGLFNDRFFISTSYYRNRSSNQLLGYLLPGITGFTSTRKNLDALVQNKGLEVEVRTSNINGKNFRWSSGFNISFQKNRLLSLGDGVYEALKKLVGQSISSVQVYKSLGVDPITGNYKFATRHGGETYSPDPVNDLFTILDLNPKYFGGIQNSISYKSCQLDILFQFVNRPNAPTYLFNYIPGVFNSSLSSGSNQPASVMNRWQKPGDVKTYTLFSQNASLANSFSNSIISDMVYGNGSFIRLKNVSLSWQFPETWKGKIGLRDARFYLLAQNLFTITSYKGLDPESQNSQQSLPPLMVVTAGLKVSM